MIKEATKWAIDQCIIDDFGDKVCAYEKGRVWGEIDKNVLTGLAASYLDDRGYEYSSLSYNDIEKYV